MKYQITIEGQMIEMPEEIAGDDEKLKSALVPFFPGAANAKIMRAPEKDGVIAVTVIKQAGTKGLLPILESAKESKNPVAVLHQEILLQPIKAAISDEEMLEKEKEIIKALELGETQVNNMTRSLDYLLSAAPGASPSVPDGF